MNIEGKIKKFERHPYEVEKQELTNLVKYIIEQRDLLQQVECKNLEEFELKLNETTSFKNANLSALAMGQEKELARLQAIEKILSAADLKDKDIDADGNFTKVFLKALNEKFTIYFTENEIVVNKKLEIIIKSYNALDFEDRRKLLVNSSNEMQTNPFIRH
jgi:hypothetical protein